MRKLFGKASVTVLGDSPADVERIRGQIAALVEERGRIEALPRPPEEALDSFKAYLDAAADRADILGFAEAFKWATARSWPTTVERAPGLMLLGMMATCFRDQMLETIGGMIRDVYDGKQSASREEQAEMLARVDADLDALCRTEEATIRAIEARGIDIARRADAPPAVVLAYDSDLEAAA